jgi:putative oxidoreductase
MLTRFLQPKTELAYSLLRIVAGAMFSFHGMQKVFGLLSTFQPPPLGSQIWVGGIIELLAGIAIALGTGTRAAAFIASGEMAVAYTQFHWKLQFGANLFPAINKGELALLYSFLFLFIACKGSGICSVDHWRRRSQN